MRAVRAALCVSLALALSLPVAVTAEDVAKPAARAHKGRKKRARAQREAPAKPPEQPAQPAQPEKSAPKPERREKPERSALADRGSDNGAASAAQAAAAAQAANATIVKEGATSVKVMSFEGLGIEGRLKSPQLVYFVQRVQAEFERPVLPHRSFMPELADSTLREPVR